MCHTHLDDPQCLQFCHDIGAWAATDVVGGVSIQARLRCVEACERLAHSVVPLAVVAARKAWPWRLAVARRGHLWGERTQFMRLEGS